MMQKAFIIIRSRAAAVCRLKLLDRQHARSAVARGTLDFAIVNVKGIQQILPTTALKPANVNLLSHWRAINFLTTSKAAVCGRMTLRFM